MSTQRESKVDESWKVVFHTTGSETYWVRAKDECEVDELGAYELEQMDHQHEWNDSEHDCNIRYLSSDEDRERLELHKMWKNGETKHGEQYYINGVKEWCNVQITREHHGAIFENCYFDSILCFDGVDFDQITLVNCEFYSRMTNIRNNCKGLTTETIAEKGTLMFEGDRDWNHDTHRYDWSYKPVVVMNFENTKIGHNVVNTKFLAVRADGTQLNHAGNVVTEEKMLKMTSDNPLGF